MGKYKIQIKVDLVECSDDSKEYELRKENNGSSTMVISEKEAESIDNCETPDAPINLSFGECPIIIGREGRVEYCLTGARCSCNPAIHASNITG